MTREEYVQQLFVQEDDVLIGVRESIVQHGMPTVSVDAQIGQLLTMLVAMSGAKRILEIGALGGYSAICMARGFRGKGHITSLELKEEFAQVARENMTKAGFSDCIDYMIGPALDSLQKLGKEQFDFIFIDADKPNYPAYLDWCLEHTTAGSIIAADNVLLRDRVLNPAIQDDAPRAMRTFNEKFASDPRLRSMMLAVCDGFSLAVRI